MNVTVWGRIVAKPRKVTSTVRVIDYLSGVFTGTLPDDRSLSFAVEIVLFDACYRSRWHRSKRSAVLEWQSISDASKVMDLDGLQDRFDLEAIVPEDWPPMTWGDEESGP